MQAGPVIPATKLHVPAPRPDAVPRPRLLEALVSSRAPLTLVDAPAGWGKTTVLAQWQADPSETRRFAWLGLDPGDNDPVRFWQCAIAALRTAEPDVGAAAAGALGAPDAPLADVAVPLLVNDLAAMERPLVLVLDDYHVISNAAIHESMTALLELLPDSAHVAIATRSDPPLPLGRMRAHGRLMEVRAADLAFDLAETAALLRCLDPADVALLAERTEGWVAGLQLAGISLRSQPDPHAFIESFAGDDRHVVDYLAGEVLDAQPDDVRAFLLHTSVLERLCAPLCDAVTGAQGSAAMLDAVERAGLFLVQLDHRRRWYRYHHLFAELLRQELALTEPALVPELHRRACEWHREAGDVEAAVHHALAADDADVAADLIAAHWRRFVLGESRHTTVEHWLAALPPGTATADVRLALVHVWTAIAAGRPDDAGRWIDVAASGSHEGPLPDGTTSLESALALLRSLHANMRGEGREGLEWARRAVALEAETSPWRAVVLSIFASNAFRLGLPEEGAPAARESVRLARAGDMHIGVMVDLALLSAHELDRDRVDDAEALAREALDMSTRLGAEEHYMASGAHRALGLVLARHGRHAEASAELERALELARRGGYPAMVDEASAALAELKPGGKPPPAPDSDLTDRELAVLRLMAGPLSLREIGTELFVSLNTVKTHTRSIYRKLGAGSRTEAVARAREAGLLPRR